MARIKDIAKKKSGKGSIGKRGSAARKRRDRCAEWAQAKGIAPDKGTAFAFCTAWEQKGILGPDGKPDAAKIPGGRKAAELDAAEPVWVDGLAAGDQPAGGYLTALYPSADGQALFGDFEKIPPSIAALLTQGRYAERSVECYTDFQGQGPALKAVAFLGVAAPAVKGMEELAQLGDDGSLEGVELVRVGTHHVSAGGDENGKWVVDQETLGKILGHWQAGAQRVPLKLGHGDQELPLAAGEQPETTIRLAEQEKAVKSAAQETEASSQHETPDGGERMSEELTALKEQIDALTAQNKKLKEAAQERVAELAKLRKAKLTSDVMADIAALSEPEDGKALPISAMTDAGLKKALLSVKGGDDVIRLGEGESAYDLLIAALKQARKAGIVQLGSKIPGGGGDNPNTPDPDAELRRAYDEAGGEAGLGVKFESWKEVG